MDVFFDQLAQGTSLGALYALLALALVFIFRSTEIVNFAQGEMAMFSTYLGWSLSRPLYLGWIPLLAIEGHVDILTWQPKVAGVALDFGSTPDGITRLGYFIVFALTVARRRFQVRAELGIAQEEPLDHWRSSAVDRLAIERALVEHGHLLFTRRRIPLPIRTAKAAADG